MLHRDLTSFDADEPRYDIWLMFNDQSDPKNTTAWPHGVSHLDIDQLIRMNRTTDKRCWSSSIEVSQSSSLIDL